MALRKCPKCETNYLRPNETLCAVCSAVMKKKNAFVESEDEEEIMCSNCGEYPAVKGKDLCEECLKEQQRQDSLELEADKIRADELEEPVEVDISKTLN